MAKTSFSFSFVILLLVCITGCSFGSRDSGILHQEKKNTPKFWCVAFDRTPANVLQDAIDFYCKQPGTDCSIIEPGGSCFQPNTLVDHASVVLNQWYRFHNSDSAFCPRDIAVIIDTDPSSGTCIYPPP